MQNLPKFVHDSLELPDVKLAIAIFIEILEKVSEFVQSKCPFLSKDVFELEVNLLNANLLVNAEVSH